MPEAEFLMNYGHPAAFLDQYEVVQNFEHRLTENLRLANYSCSNQLLYRVRLLTACGHQRTRYTHIHITLVPSSEL